MPEPRGPLACLCHRRTGGHRFGLRVEHRIQPFAEALFIPNFVHSVKEVSTYLRSVARADGWRTEDHVDPVAALVEIAAEPPRILDAPFCQMWVRRMERVPYPRVVGKVDPGKESSAFDLERRLNSKTAEQQAQIPQRLKVAPTYWNRTYWGVEDKNPGPCSIGPFAPFRVTHQVEPRGDASRRWGGPAQWFSRAGGTENGQRVRG